MAGLNRQDQHFQEESSLGEWLDCRHKTLSFSRANTRLSGGRVPILYALMPIIKIFQVTEVKLRACNVWFTHRILCNSGNGHNKEPIFRRVLVKRCGQIAGV